jgi:hypothetical protein
LNFNDIEWLYLILLPLIPWNKDLILLILSKDHFEMISSIWFWIPVSFLDSIILFKFNWFFQILMFPSEDFFSKFKFNIFCPLLSYLCYFDFCMIPLTVLIRINWEYLRFDMNFLFSSGFSFYDHGIFVLINSNCFLFLDRNHEAITFIHRNAWKDLADVSPEKLMNRRTQESQPRTHDRPSSYQDVSLQVTYAIQLVCL